VSTSIIHSPNRVLAIVAGIVFLFIGLLGFLITTTAGFFSTEGHVLIGLFALNPFLSSIFAAVGGILLLSGLVGPRSSRAFNTVFGIAFFLLGAVFLFAHHTAANVFAMNSADIVLTLIAGAVLFVVGVKTDAPEPKAIAA
jgi:hypothetical protein